MTINDEFDSVFRNLDFKIYYNKTKDIYRVVPNNEGQYILSGLYHKTKEDVIRYAKARAAGLSENINKDVSNAIKNGLYIDSQGNTTSHYIPNGYTYVCCVDTYIIYYNMMDHRYFVINTTNNSAGNYYSAKTYSLDDLKEKYKNTKTKKEDMPMENKFMRLIRVVVLDLDPRVPVSNRTLYDSGEFWSEDLNEDLYYNINLKQKLEEHNAYRKTVVWEEKDCNGKTHTVNGLPEIKFSDLKKEVIKYVEFPLKKV